ncbi:MAG: hypothetical protein ACTHMS_12220 [Jatrophihabitans sp.]|uniref:hypothetical protein n=1 Tax=Jatrophihabitans sp. TaxID=1932789 RepID=UPI003F7E70BB
MFGKYSLLAAAVMASPLLALPLLPAEATGHAAPLRPTTHTHTVRTNVTGAPADAFSGHVAVVVSHR